MCRVIFAPDTQKLGWSGLEWAGGWTRAGQLAGRPSLLATDHARAWRWVHEDEQLCVRNVAWLDCCLAQHLEDSVLELRFDSVFLLLSVTSVLFSQRGDIARCCTPFRFRKTGR